MLYLKLLDDKTLKLNQSNKVYEGENEADSIVVYLHSKWEDYKCTLNILIENQVGDICQVVNGDKYILTRKLLEKEQDLILWIEMQKGTVLAKSSQLKLHVNQHHNIEEIVEDTDLSIFETMLQNALKLNEEALQIKNQLPDLEVLDETIKKLNEGLIKLNEFSTASIEDIENLFKKGGEI